MEAKKYAVVNYGLIVNIIMWDGETPFVVAECELILIEGTDYKIGDIV